MRETGILFTPENIRATREGRKTQTRRVMSPQPVSPANLFIELEDREGGPGLWHAFETSENWKKEDFDVCEPAESFHRCLQGVPGDRLYIKEGIIRHASIPQLVGYYMDGCRVTEHWEKRSTARFMPKWAARTWLKLTDVRVERLQDISEEDALAEGIIKENVIVGANCNGGVHHEETADRYFTPNNDDYAHESAVDAYHVLWDSINLKKHPWSSNPWCWCLTFQILESR